MDLWARIKQDELWPILEQVTIQTVTAGGMAAMGFYRDAWKKQALLDEKSGNASTTADLQATSTILQACHSLLSPIAGQLACGLSYLGEETKFDELLQKTLGDDVLQRKHAPERFFATRQNTLRVIFDGIDGTANFNRGIPLFCTAAAILVDDQVRVSAIYDPIHHQVCSSLLPGPSDNPEAGATASVWEVATGNRVDLVAESRKAELKSLGSEAVGIHLTRSDKSKLRDFLDPTVDKESMLQRLAAASGGIYALNTGILAMKEVARGAVGAFVNITTNPWDIAAGEVLVRACGGKVTDFSGDPIGYSTPNRVSLIAAKGHLHAQILDLLRPGKEGRT